MSYCCYIENEFIVLITFNQHPLIDLFKKTFYNHITKYYEDFQIHPEIEIAKEFESCKMKKRHYPFPPYGQGILKILINYSQTTNNILHLGAFGHTALTLNKLCSIRGNQNHYSDIDVLFVSKEGVEIVKNELINILNNELVELVFGFDNDYFYHFRDKGKITLDIEIFNKNSNFYEMHKLLGFSIFSNYYTLYSYDNLILADVINIPIQSESKEKRGELLITDRKGLNEFIKRLESNNNNLIDPRRVLTLSIKNFNWYLTGVHTYDIKSSYKYIFDQAIIDQRMYNFIQSTIDQSEEYIKNDYNNIMKVTLGLIKILKEKIK